MSDKSSQQPEAEEHRDEKGRFAPKKKTDEADRSTPEFTDFSFINAFMAEQLGLSDKFAELQQQFPPDELYKHLKFVATTTKGKTQEKPKLGDNQPIVPITPQPSKLDIPGAEIIGKPNLTGSNFSLQVKMNPRELLKPKK